MTFTEEDAQDDGKIKRQAGERLHSKLASQSGVLYSLFEEYCDENGIDPKRVLGDMLLRALKDEGYAERVQQTVVEPQKLQTEQVRQEDLELVTELIDKYADDDSGQGQDPVMSMLNRRLQAVGSGPLSGITDSSDGGGSQSNGNIERRLDRLESMIQDMSEGGTSSSQESSDDSSVTQDAGSPVDSDEEDIEKLFDDGGSDSQPETDGVEPNVDSPDEDADFSYEVDTGGFSSSGDEPEVEGEQEEEPEGDSKEEDLSVDPEDESELIGSEGPHLDDDGDDEGHPTFSTDRAGVDDEDS